MAKQTLDKLVLISSAISEAKSSGDLRDALQHGCTLLGFDRFILSCNALTKRDVVVNATLTTFPDEYRRDYDDLNWVDGDMHTDRAMQAHGTFFWDSDDEHYLEPRKQGYLDFLKASRMKMGVVVSHAPCAGAASLFAMASLNGVPVSPVVESAAAILADFARIKAEMLGLVPVISADEAIALRALSPVQSEILNWVAEGKSNTDIATIMNVNERAVRYHVSEILRKLCVATRSQAASIGRRSS